MFKKKSFFFIKCEVKCSSKRWFKQIFFKRLPIHNKILKRTITTSKSFNSTGK